MEFGIDEEESRSEILKMATTGGDDDDDPPTIVDQDEDQEEAISKVPADGDKDQGVGKRKRNPAGILRIDTSMAAASGSPRTSRRKSSAGSVLDYRFAATLNPVRLFVSRLL